MNQTLEFVARNGAVVIFVIVFLDQLGFPIPTIPILLAFGALAGRGQIDPVLGLLIAITASVCADLVWFQLGRWKGTQALGLLCRMALEPDSCVSKTHDVFAKHGLKSLLVAKFVPGLDTVAPPIAGMLGVRVVPFMLWSAGGALLWLGTFGGLGFLFSDRLEQLAEAADRLGSTFGLVVLALLAAYIAWKYTARQRVLRSIRMTRITPDELQEMIASGCALTILDARNQSALDALPFLIQGARLVGPDGIDEKHLDFSRETEIIVYCS